METALNYLDDKVMFVSSDEPRMRSRISKLAEAHPSECVITVRPENNDGCMVAKMPASWLKIGPPRKGSHREYTEEEKEQLRERMKVAQAAKEAKKKGSAAQ